MGRPRGLIAAAFARRAPTRRSTVSEKVHFCRAAQGQQAGGHVARSALNGSALAPLRPKGCLYEAAESRKAMTLRKAAPGHRAREDEQKGRLMKRRLGRMDKDEVKK